MKTIVRTSAAPAALGPYSQAVRAGDMLYTAGQVPLRPDGTLVEGGIEAQTERVMENLKAILESAGATFDDVVKTTCFLADMADFPAFNEVYGRSFGSQPPARSTVEVARLPKDVAVEVEVVAYLPSH